MKIWGFFININSTLLIVLYWDYNYPPYIHQCMPFLPKAHTPSVTFLIPPNRLLFRRDIITTRKKKHHRILILLIFSENCMESHLLLHRPRSHLRPAAGPKPQPCPPFSVPGSSQEPWQRTTLPEAAQQAGNVIPFLNGEKKNRKGVFLTNFRYVNDEICLNDFLIALKFIKR